MKTQIIHRAFLFLFASALVACGSSDSTEEPHSDIPADDAGAGGSDGDADTDQDADPGDDASPGDESVVIEAHVPTGARRGPVLLAFDIEDPNGDVAAVRLQRDDNGSWVDASSTLVEETEGKRVFVWDSFADVNVDGDVTLRLLAEAKDREVSKSFEVQVRNAPDTDRVILYGNPMIPRDGGGTVNEGAEVTAFVWGGTTESTVGSPKRLTVGKGPRTLVAAPHGRATAVVNDTDGTVSIVTTPLDANLGGVEQAHSVTLPHGGANAVRWSPDGRYLYVVGTKKDALPNTIWRYEPSEDLSQLGDATSLATLHGNSFHMAVERTTGRLLATVGWGDNDEQPGLALFAPDGTPLVLLEDGDLMLPNTLAVSPAGGLALWTSDIFGDELRVFDFDGTSIAQRGDVIDTVMEPTDIVFHPMSTKDKAVALVSNLSRNRVTPVVVTPEGVEVGGSVAGMGLAAEMDMIERGTQMGTTFITGVSQEARIHRVTLGADGSVTAHDPALEPGPGPTNIPFGIAVQR